MQSREGSTKFFGAIHRTVIKEILSEKSTSSSQSEAENDASSGK
jgi:hypothetical protein